MSVERELAVHETEIKHLQTDMDKLVQDMESIKATLTDINTTLAEARGGWRVLMMVGGAGGALGAMVTQFAHKLFGQEITMIINENGWGDKKEPEAKAEVKDVRKAKLQKDAPVKEVVEDAEQE